MARDGVRAARAAASCRLGVSRRSPCCPGAASHIGARPDAAPVAPSPRRCGCPCPARTWPSGGGPATSFEARAPSARAGAVGGRCGRPSLLLVWAHCAEAGRFRPVRSLSRRTRRECVGVVDPYGADQPCDHWKGRQKPLLLTPDAAAPASAIRCRPTAAQVPSTAHDGRLGTDNRE